MKYKINETQKKLKINLQETLQIYLRNRNDADSSTFHFQLHSNSNSHEKNIKYFFNLIKTFPNSIISETGTLAYGM